MDMTIKGGIISYISRYIQLMYLNFLTNRLGLYTISVTAKQLIQAAPYPVIIVFGCFKRDFRLAVHIPGQPIFSST